MAEKADANRGQLILYPESEWGEPVEGTPNFKMMRITGESLEHEKTTVQSAEIRADGNIRSLAEVDIRATGGINFELAFGGQDDAIAAVLRADTGSGGDSESWKTPVVTTGAVAADPNVGTAQTGKFSQASGTPFDTIFPGQYVRVSGYTEGAVGCNGIWRVLTISENKREIVVDDPDGDIISDAGTTAKIVASMCRNGVTPVSYNIEKQFLDVAKFFQLLGMRFGQMTLALASGAIVGGTFSLQGKRGQYVDATLGDGSPAEPAASDAMNATSNVGTIFEGATLTPFDAALRRVELAINANLGARPAIATKGGVGIRYGSLVVTGSLEAYFEDETLGEKVINHTTSGLHLRIFDVDGEAETGNAILITLPVLKWMSKGTPLIPGLNSDVTINPGFQATVDATGSPKPFTIQFDKLTA